MLHVVHKDSRPGNAGSILDRLCEVASMPHPNLRSGLEWLKLIIVSVECNYERGFRKVLVNEIKPFVFFLFSNAISIISKKFSEF